MAKELKTLEHVCDSCGKKAVAKATPDSLPRGWMLVPMHGCCMTVCTKCKSNYTS